MNSGVNCVGFGGVAPQRLMNGPHTAGQNCRGVQKVMTPEPQNGPYCPYSCYNNQTLLFAHVQFSRATEGAK